MSNGIDSDGRGRGGDGFDDSDITHVEEPTGQIIARLGRLLCETAIDVGRYGNSLGGLSADSDGDGNPHAEAERLRRAHVYGQTATRYLRELIEHAAAVNELLGKQAKLARARASAAPPPPVPR